jgi:hypothetical protein
MFIAGNEQRYTRENEAKQSVRRWGLARECSPRLAARAIRRREGQKMGAHERVASRSGQDHDEQCAQAL